MKYHQSIKNVRAPTSSLTNQPRVLTKNTIQVMIIIWFFIILCLLLFQEALI